MRFTPRIPLGCLSIMLALLLLVSCSDLLKSDDEEHTTRVLVEADKGGEVASPDGLLTLTIPAGALHEDTYIEIGVVDPSDHPESLSDMNLAGKVYSLEPDGLGFDYPAAIEIEMTEDELESDRENGEYTVVSAVLMASDGTIEPVDTSTVWYNLEDKMLFSGKIDHFSRVIRFIGFTNYPYPQRIGRAKVGANLGPTKTSVGPEYLVRVDLANRSDLDLHVDVQNLGLLDVEWNKTTTAFDVGPHGRDYKYIDPKWSCGEPGQGAVYLEVFVTILNPEVNSWVDRVVLSQGVDCLSDIPGATNCMDSNLRRLMEDFFLPLFNKEPCSDVREPEGDGTVKNSWGEVKDVSQTMAGTYRLGEHKETITQEDWWNIEEMYPLGPDNFYIGSPDRSADGGFAAMGSIGDWIIFFNVMYDTIPETDPTNYFQYGFVFDRDGDTENNYEPYPSYPYDFFQDTDYWIVASYDPLSGWSLQATDAEDSAPTPVASDAKMLILGNTLILLVPREEFEAERIGYRLTAYRHPGDWGTGGDWDGDVQPPVADGLTWIDIGPE
jgi:hypothetical protein